MNTQTTTWRPTIWHNLVALMTLGGCIGGGVYPLQAETPGKTAGWKMTFAK